MPTNKERAERAQSIINLYTSTHDFCGEPDKDVVPDILADLAHFCSQSDPHISFEDALRVAQMHFLAETEEVNITQPSYQGISEERVDLDRATLLPKGENVLLSHIHKLLKELAVMEHRIGELEVLVDQKCAALDRLHDKSS